MGGIALEPFTPLNFTKPPQTVTRSCNVTFHYDLRLKSKHDYRFLSGYFSSALKGLEHSWTRFLLTITFLFQFYLCCTTTILFMKTLIPSLSFEILDRSIKKLPN